MKLVGKVPVEPLEEERLTNIERNLVIQVSEMAQRPVRAPSRMLAFAGVALAIAVAGFVGWRLRGGAPVAAPSQPEQLALHHQTLQLGDAEITSSATAEAKVERTAARIVVTMAIGKLDLHVEHKPGRVFVVKAGDVEIEDVGTRFSVDYDGKKHVDVRVTEGEVKVRSGGKEIEIAATEAWTLEFGKSTIVTLEQREAAQNHAVVASNTPANPATNTPSNHDVVEIAPSGSNGSGGSGSSARGSGESHKGVPKGVPNSRRALEKLKLREAIDIGISKPKDDDFFKRVVDAKTQQDKAWLFYSAALVQHRSKNDDVALHTLSSLLRPDRSGDAYQASLWLQVHIRCLRAYDDKCREAAGLYLRKFDSGPEAGIAQEILKDVQ